MFSLFLLLTVCVICCAVNQFDIVMCCSCCVTSIGRNVYAVGFQQLTRPRVFELSAQRKIGSVNELPAREC